MADTFDGKTATPVAAASVTNTTRVLGGDTAGTGLVIAVTALQQAIARLCADKADARTQLGLGSAAVESASAFDAVGSASAAEAAAILASCQRASNLSDLASKIAALDTITLKGADIASATTTDLSAATGDYVDVTGTTTITGLGTCAAGVERTVRFTGALTLTHNATSLILPGAANITTAANDRAIFRSLGSGNWLCVTYVKASGEAVVAGASGLTTVTGTGSAGAGTFYSAPNRITTTGTVNDWNPGVSRHYFLDPGVASLTLTGLVAGTDGEERFIHQNSGTNAVTLNNLDTGSTAANRFYNVGNTNITMAADSRRVALLVYDATLSRWRVHVITA